MSTASLRNSEPAVETEAEVRLVDLTSDEFFGMIDSEVFAPQRRIFLWGGRLFEKMAKTPSHAITSYIFHETLRSRLPADWLIWPENPVRLDARHAPLPDISVVRGPIGRYRGPQDRHGPGDRHPEVADVGLLVEISVSSLPKDLGERAEKFARALVPVYWVADVFGGRIIEHRGPRDIEGVGSFAIVQPYDRDGEIPLVLAGREILRIPVRELLGGSPGLPVA